MSNFDKLTALGAYSCGGDLLWKNKTLGHFRNGDLILTEEGILALSIEDAVEVKAPKSKGKKADKPAVADDEPEIDITE